MCLKDSYCAPGDDGEDVHSAAEDKHANEGGEVVSKGILKRMSILRGDTDWVHVLMVLLVEPSVEIKVLMFAMKSSVSHVEAEVLADNAD